MSIKYIFRMRASGRACAHVYACEDGPRLLEGRGVDKEQKLLYSMGQKFLRSPGRRWAVGSLELCRRLDLWTSVGLTGKYIEHWEKRYCVKWRLSSVATAAIEEDLLLVLNREGLKNTLRAIDVVFGPQMRWADNQIGLLSGKDTFTRFIIPHLAVKRVGEQAEWTKPNVTSGSREVSL